MKVMVGLSGGVDSAVAAYLLKERGYDVICGFMRNWDSMMNNDYYGNPTVNNDICPQEQDYLDAKDVAERLNLPLLRIDYIKGYWDNVFSYFLDKLRYTFLVHGLEESWQSSSERAAPSRRGSASRRSRGPSAGSLPHTPTTRSRSPPSQTSSAGRAPTCTSTSAPRRRSSCS